MKTFSIHLEAGGRIKTILASGEDIYAALRNAGFNDPEAAMWSRVITYTEVS